MANGKMISASASASAINTPKCIGYHVAPLVLPPTPPRPSAIQLTCFSFFSRSCSSSLSCLFPHGEHQTRSLSFLCSLGRTHTQRLSDHIGLSSAIMRGRTRSPRAQQNHHDAQLGESSMHARKRSRWASTELEARLSTQERAGTGVLNGASSATQTDPPAVHIGLGNGNGHGNGNEEAYAPLRRNQACFLDLSETQGEFVQLDLAWTWTRS